MATPPNPVDAVAQTVRGKIIDAVVKVSVDATRPLPLACALYAVEAPDGVWLCAYYGSNKSVFDYLPQKDQNLDEIKSGISFHSKKFIPSGQYQPALWEEFKKERFMAYGAHAE